MYTGLQERDECLSQKVSKVEYNQGQPPCPPHNTVEPTGFYLGAFESREDVVRTGRRPCKICKPLGGRMARTFIQVTALSLVLMSSFFLIKGVISLSAQDIIKLSQTPFGGTYMRMVKNLTQQKSDTIVGFVLLLASFFLSLINFLWLLRIDDFRVSPAGVITALLVSAAIFLVAYKSSKFLRQKLYGRVKDMLAKRNQL